MGETLPVSEPLGPGAGVDAVVPGRIGLLVRVPVKPGMRAAALDVLNRYVDDLDEEPGTEAFFLCVEPDDSDVVWLYEWFHDEESLEAHRSAPLFSRLMTELPDLVADGPGIMRLDPLRLRMSAGLTAWSL
jgi:quinol monooxygenase YgiN